MKALVTGGAGFIGSHVVDCLLEYGWEVDVLDNLSTGTRDNLNPFANFIFGDVASKKTAGRIISKKPNAIIHLAAQADVQTSVQQPLRDQRTNIVGTIRVLEAARHLGAKLVFASTGGAIYGECWKPASETDLPRPVSPYGVSKLSAEHYLLAWNEMYGMENVILRYSNVYGPRQLAKAEGGVVAIFKDALERDMSPTVYGDGNQFRDFIHVHDVKDVTVSAVNLKGGIYNVSTGSSMSILELLHMLGAEEWEHAEARRGDLYCSALDPTKLKNELMGWQPRVLNEALVR